MSTNPLDVNGAGRDGRGVNVASRTVDWECGAAWRQKEFLPGDGVAPN